MYISALHNITSQIQNTNFTYIISAPPMNCFRRPSATVVSTEPLSHRTGTLRCLQKEMTTYGQDTDLCPCRDPGKSCPLTKLNGGLSQLHYADKDAVSWLTNYSS